MEASTLIKELFAGKQIFVPSYQRAYSWETPSDNDNSIRKTHTDVFLQDLADYYHSSANTPYYFGHFLFEKKSDNHFDVIDGQQRLTTIVIFLCALFSKLKSIRNLTDDEEILHEDMIKRKHKYIFSTVDYDNRLFIDYVIDQTKIDGHGLETESQRRIVKAFDFFKKALAGKDEQYLNKMLKIVSEASCTHNLSRDK